MICNLWAIIGNEDIPESTSFERQLSQATEMLSVEEGDDDIHHHKSSRNNGWKD